MPKKVKNANSGGEGTQTQGSKCAKMGTTKSGKHGIWGGKWEMGQESE
jgi:hypothetical protein